MRCLLSLAALGLMTGLAAADDLRQNVGIGIGTMIFDGQTGLLSQVCAATTNTSTCYNQTWMITTGLGGARPWSGIVSRENVQYFIRENMDLLAREMAAGRGESLETLAALMGVPADQHPAYIRTLHEHFAEIYDLPWVTDVDVLAHIEAVTASS